MLVSKKADGQRTLSFDPPAPQREISVRLKLIENIRFVVERSNHDTTLSADVIEFAGEMGALADRLENSKRTLEPDLLTLLQDLLSRIEKNKDSLPVSTSRGAKLLTLWTATLQAEEAPTPWERARAALWEKWPDFLFFNDEARNLASSYSIAELRNSIPVALQNLAEVAELDFPRLFLALDQNQSSVLTTIEHKANTTISEKFKTAWKQSDISVAIRIHNGQLEVQIVDPRREFTSFSERSDGLRQFVALQMFAMRNHTDRPVLLIDEAEQRLHYDAQADLTQMLARQKLASKVIYTTHSAGCLPEDLGSGVRTILPNEQNGSSSIVNRFWSSRENGFAPVLYGLGASTMAFFPTRRAVMVEGPSDMLLYPTLFRESLDLTTLGFQFAPGLSRIETDEVRAIGTGVIYLVDGDQGGKELKIKLKGLGVPDEDIYTMQDTRSGCFELEDFVDERLLIDACNDIIQKWHATSTQIDTLDTSQLTRMQALEKEFLASTGKKLPKIDVAYYLLSIVEQNPNAILIDKRRSSAFRRICEKILNRISHLSA